MAAIAQIPFVRYLDNARTEISFTVDEFSNRNGYTFIGRSNGTIERYQNGVVITCGPYQFGLTPSDIQALRKRSYLQHKIMTIWRTKIQVTEFRLLDGQIEILEKIVNPKLLTEHPYLQTTKYTIVVHSMV